MTGIEIALIAAGIICICASFFISQKQKPEEDGISSPASVSAEIWTEKDEEMVRERIHEMLSGEQDETIAVVKEQLERMSNEKIMAVDEFSGQILEKIKSNHQEVVFMYNMLNDKQRELKTVMENARVQEEALREAGRRQEAVTQTALAPSAEQIRTPRPVPVARPVPQQEQNPSGGASAPRAQAAPAQKMAGAAEPSNRVTQADSLRGKKAVRQAAAPAKTAPKAAGGAQTAISRMEAAKAAKRARQNRQAEQPSVQQQTPSAGTDSRDGQVTPVVTPERPSGPAVAARRPAAQPVRTVPEPAASGSGDVNQMIQKMYKEGKSVLEISKALNIGQGEVKLVIALYGGKKR